MIDIDSIRAWQFIPYDPVASFTIHNSEAEEKGRQHFYFVTAMGRTNVESPPVPTRWGWKPRRPRIGARH